MNRDPVGPRTPDPPRRASPPREAQPRNEPGSRVDLSATLTAERRRARLQRDRLEAQLDRLQAQLEHARQQTASRERALKRAQQETDPPLVRLIVRLARRLARIGRDLPIVGRGSPRPDVAHQLPRDRERAADRRRSIEERVGHWLVAGLPPAPPMPARRIHAVIDRVGDDAALARAIARLADAGIPKAAISTVGGASDDATPRGAEALRVYREIVGSASPDDLILVLSDTVEPLEPGWLARLVDDVETNNAAAVGPTLLVTQDDVADRDPRVSATRGVSFGLDGGLPSPVEHRTELAPMGRTGAPVWTTGAVQALSRGCVLLRAGAVIAARGVRDDDLVPVPGDLFARLADTGRPVMVSGSSIVWDRRPPGPPDATAATDRPGEAARMRRLLLRTISAADDLSRPPFHVALANGAASIDGLDRGLVSLGWQTSVIDTGTTEPADWDPTIAVAVVADPAVGRQRLPRHLISVAWITDRPDAWMAAPAFDDHDLVLVPTEALQSAIEAGSAKRAMIVDLDRPPSIVAATFRSVLRTWAEIPKIAIHIAPLDREAAARWGDTHFARGIQRAFERQGWGATVHIATERNDAPAIRADVALHLFGVSAPPVRPGQVSILWVISHPDLVRARVARRYDLVFVASETFADELASRIATPVRVLHQATDPARFYPEANGPAHELLFVGNSRGARRPIVEDLARSSHELAVYGGGWKPEILDPRHVRGEYIANGDLHRYYSSAAVVLNDHWDDMREEGFISNRVYDALASGAFVVSDRVPGMEERFDGAVATFMTRDELPAVVDHFLAHPEERRERAEHGRSAVLAGHTFDHRARSIIAALTELGLMPEFSERDLREEAQPAVGRSR
jgi:glycosyltransferase involved in cell wall biosynthesis